ncbi:hypothetical protein CLAIMM_03879 [Cladophialophora immunda]|nr:hypothetical protein CLAIMM_03879 [Cladophialophora immunda]
MANYFEHGVALITGSGSGIGRATAEAFASRGCKRLVLADISAPGLAETAGHLKEKYPGVAIEDVCTDVSDETSVEICYGAAVSKFGRVDYVANVAGYVAKYGTILEQDDGEWGKTYATCLRGVFLSQRAALRQMTKQEPLQGSEQRGVIVNVGSTCSTVALPGMSMYSAAKAGVLGLTKSDALDFGPQKIRLNCVAPGTTITPTIMAATTREFRDHLSEKLPLRRIAEAAEVANTIVWLCSPEASYVTGAYIVVDGGFNLGTGTLG